MERRPNLKLTNEEIFAAYPALNALNSMEWPVVISFALSELGVKLLEPYRLIVAERDKLIKKYGVVDTAADGWKVPQTSDNRPAYDEEFEKLMKIERTLNLDAETRKIKLPQTIVRIVEGKKIDVPVHILPALLMPLGKFVEIG